MISEESARKNLDALKYDIRQITDRDITIVAVTKTHPEEIFDLCVKLGVEHVGENRIQELLQKNRHRPDARKKLKIHLIGPLQTNKVKFLPENVDSFDALSSPETLEKIDQRWNLDTPLSLLLQVNCTNEEQKSGLSLNSPDGKEEIFQLVDLCARSQKVRLEGLMTMGPTPAGNYDVEDPDYIKDTRASFLRLAALRNEIQDRLKIHLPRLSMGMTHDYKIAIECGATEIRVGSLLFGDR